MEENYEILSLSDFWKEALYYSTNTTASTGRRLEQIPISSEAKNVAYEALKNPPGGVKNPYTEDIARARLLEFAERQGKRLLLICENMNNLFSVLPEQDSWKLRNVLQTEKRIMLIGSATTRFGQIDHNKKAFYDFFKILNLERLTTEECAELWLSESKESITYSQADALRILTGGLPRLVSILAWFGRNLSFLELMRDLEELIDDLMRRGGAEALFVYDVVNFLTQVFGSNAIDIQREFGSIDTRSMTERERRNIDYLDNQGSYEEAEKLYRETLELRRRVL